MNTKLKSKEEIKQEIAIRNAFASSPIIFTPGIIDTIAKWEDSRSFKLTNSSVNFSVVTDYIRRVCGNRYTPRTLDDAVESCWAALTFQKGFEMEDPAITRKRKAQEEADKKEVERQRKHAEALAQKRKDQRPASIVDVATEKDKIYRDSQDVNSDLFKKLQEHNRIRFNTRCAEYARYSPRGIMMFGITDERRKLLKAILILDERKDAAGKDVVRYDKMLEEQKKLLQRFENQDSRM